MKEIIAIIEQPWPWYISGPLLGTIVPLLLLFCNKQFGVSSVFKSLSFLFFRYGKENEFHTKNLWRLYFVFGILLAGVLTFNFLSIELNELSVESKHYFNSKEIVIEGIFPSSFFHWKSIFSVKGLILLFGGLFIGFGSRYSGGCTSGHAIMGLSQLSIASLVAVISFFIGGIIGSFLIIDKIL